MESDVMDAKGSLHQNPRESDVMDAQGSLHQNPREVCITEDTESIDLGRFENTRLIRVKNGTRCLLQVGVRDWDSLGTSPSMILTGFFETVAEFMDAKTEGGRRDSSFKKTTSGGTSSFARPVRGRATESRF